MKAKRKRHLWLVAVACGLAVSCLTGCDEAYLSERLAEAEELPPPVIAVLLGTSTVISEDLACVSAGVLAARDVLPYWMAALGCLAGIWLGDLGLYGLGRLGRGKLLHRAPFRWFISARRVEQGRQLFSQHGGKLVFSSRFLPGSRLPIYVAAGLVKYPFGKFAGFMALACLLWTPVLVAFAMKIGDALLSRLAAYERAVWLVLVLVIVVIWMVTRVLEYGVTHRGRRLLRAKWARLWEWEFWPMWAFYPPVILEILFHAIRHRSLTLFTLANPSMPLGGLALESKSEILAAFGDGKRGRSHIAPWTLLEPGKLAVRLAKLEAFLEREGLGFPVVLKPDVGERGQGVAVISDASEATFYLEGCEHPIIAQEFVDGLEFGIFYYRYPNADRGEILSITEKLLPSVAGDGERTLEQLILDDERAVKMARFFLEKWTHHLAEVPAVGEEIRLTDLGTHCRGAIFRDGRDHRTEPLRAAIDELSREYEGFFFGRYDLKVPSIGSLEAGEEFKILELNGVTSESTHIYSPGYSLVQAWRDLVSQWRIAFEIGAENRLRGETPPGLKEVLKTVREHRDHDWFEVPARSSELKEKGDSVAP